MNYIKALNVLGKLVKSGQIKSVEEAIGALQQMGAQVDGLLKQGVENLFKTTKARNPEAFKGWTPSVIEGGKEKAAILADRKKTMEKFGLIEKEGVENLFKETKKVDLPEGVNWKDTPLPVNPKVESFYDELVENAYKESKKTGRDVKTIIEETIDYKFTGNESMKEIIDIVEAKFFKADGGRIGFRRGGRGRQDRMGGTMEQTAQELREAAPDQFGGGMNISHGGGGRDDPPSIDGGGNLNISPIATYQGPYNDQVENVGLRANIGKLVAAGVINLEDLITTGDIEPTVGTNLNLGNFNLSGIKNQDQTGILASGAIGPVNVGGSYEDFGEYGTSKNIGATAQLGNVNIGANYDFENKPNVGLSYNDPDSGWSGGVSYNFEGKPEGRIELKKTFKKGGRVNFGVGGLSEQAQGIYNSWISAGHSEADALDYLTSRGMYDAGDGGVESIINTQQSIVPQGGGGGGGIGGLDLTYTPGAVAKTPPMGVDPSTVNIQEIDDYGTYAPRTGVMGMWDKTKDFFSNLGTPRVRGTLGTRMANQPSIPLPGALAAYSFSPFNEKSRNYNPNLVDQLNYLEGQEGLIGRDQGSGLLRYGPESVLSGKNVTSLLGTNDYEKMLMDYITKMNSYSTKRALTDKQIAKIKKAEQELTDHRNKAVRVNRQADGTPAYNPTGEGNQTPGIGWNETGGPVSNKTGRGRTDWADGGQVGLATMFTRRR